MRLALASVLLASSGCQGGNDGKYRCPPDLPIFPLLITGTSHSGTHELSFVFQEGGLDLPHEVLGADGAVSWLYAAQIDFVKQRRDESMRSARKRREAGGGDLVGGFRAAAPRPSNGRGGNSTWVGLAANYPYRNCNYLQLKPGETATQRRCSFRPMRLDTCMHPCLPERQFRATLLLTRDPLYVHF